MGRDRGLERNGERGSRCWKIRSRRVPGTVWAERKRIPEMADVEIPDDVNEPAWRAARRLAEPERGAVARRAAHPAIPRRGVRADGREGHDRLHDPRGHRPLEAVAPRLLPVLRRQGRAAARAVRGEHARSRSTDHRACGRGGVRTARTSARLQHPSARVVRSLGYPAQARRAQPPADHRSSWCSSRSTIPIG